MMRNMKNKNYRFVSFLPDAQKKTPKKLKKLKNSKKNSVTFQSDAQQKILEKQQNNSKN